MLKKQSKSFILIFFNHILLKTTTSMVVWENVVLQNKNQLNNTNYINTFKYGVLYSV